MTPRAATASSTPSYPADRVRLVDLPASDFELRTARSESDGIGLLVGHGAVFNVWTEIDSWEGHFKERFAPGAFARTIREDRAGFKVLFNHGFDPSIGDKPLGNPRVLKEDDIGLYMEVPLDDTSYNRDLLASLKSGAIAGMSVRFRVAEEGQTWRTPRVSQTHNPDMLQERTINEVLRLYEAGPCTFPAYLAASAGVRDWKTWQALGERMSARKQRALRATAKVYAVRADIAAAEIAEYVRKHGGYPLSKRDRLSRLQRKVLVSRVQATVYDATRGRVA